MEKKTITYEIKNCTVNVHVPNLTDEEREKRVEQLRQATIQFFRTSLSRE